MNTSVKSRRSSASPFTLIELLVVVVIIAILASLILPALAKAKFRARLSLCIANQKQQGAAIIAYTSDADEWYPVYQSYPEGTYVGDDHPFATSKHKPMWPYLGIGEDDGKPVSPYGWDHPVYKPGPLQCPQGLLEVGWANNPKASHSHPDKGYYNWYFDTWGGINDPGQTKNMMRKQGNTFTTGKAWTKYASWRQNHNKLKFDILASDVYKLSSLGGSTGAQTNHVWGGDRFYPGGYKGSSHFSHGPLYFATVTGMTYSAYTFSDGRVEVFGPAPAYWTDYPKTVRTSSATASGGWNLPVEFAVD